VPTNKFELVQLALGTDTSLLPDGVSGATVWAIAALSSVFIYALLTECLFTLQAVSRVVD